MKNVILKSLSMINFKGEKGRTTEFSETETSILGDNGVGKSRHFDAFTWLLFGKDQFDRKDHEIYTTENGKRLDKVDAEVSAIVSVDGQETELKRVFRQKWVRKRGTEVEVYDGNETLYYINSVPKKAGEYKELIDSIIDETVFKMITNPSYFLNLKWQDQRENLFQIAGTISDHEIASSKPEYKALLDNLSGKSMADFKKEISARKRKLNDDLKLIPSKIDQTKRLMPEKWDFESLEKQLIDIDQEVKQIDEQIADKSKAIRAQYEAVRQVQNQVNELQIKQQSVFYTAKENAESEVYKSNAERRKLENDISEKKQSLLSAERSLRASKETLQDLLKNKANVELQIENKRKEWHSVNEKEFVDKEGTLICPIFNRPCGDPEALTSYEETKYKAKGAFFKNKEADLQKVNEEGAALKSKLEAIEKDISNTQIFIEKDNAKVEEISADLKDSEQKLAKKPLAEPSEVIANELPEWQALQKEIDQLEAAKQEDTPVDTSDLQARKKGFLQMRDEVKGRLNDKALIEKYGVEIKNLEAEAKQISQQIADIEKQEFTIADFTRAKINESEARINSLFEVVNFQLFDVTIDGNEFETCIATNKIGVPISTTNTAEGINAGLDVINTLCKFHNATAPIFIDRRESVNKLIKTESQIVNLIVTKDKELIVQ